MVFQAHSELSISSPDLSDPPPFVPDPSLGTVVLQYVFGMQSTTTAPYYSGHFLLAIPVQTLLAAFSAACASKTRSLSWEEWGPDGTLAMHLLPHPSLDVLVSGSRIAIFYLSRASGAPGDMITLDVHPCAPLAGGHILRADTRELVSLPLKENGYTLDCSVVGESRAFARPMRSTYPFRAVHNVLDKEYLGVDGGVPKPFLTEKGIAFLVSDDSVWPTN